MRILVVDDDIDIRGFLKSNLETECFIVDTAGNGEDASYQGRIHDYDLIILDNNLPKKSGSEVCKEIRKSGKTTPIIILSVQSETEDKIDLLNAGADDYVTKPFSYKELRSRINAVLRRPHLINPTILKIDNLTIDTAKQIVHRGKEDLYLTRKEFSLAEYLLKNKGSVVSRGMLMEHVWNDDIDPFSNTVEAHILNLRRKIDRPYKKKLIHTVPGRGYKIDCTNYR